MLPNGQYSASIPLFRFLDTNGDGTGTSGAAADYSVTPETFFIRPSNTDIFIIKQLKFHIVDAGKFDYDEFGAIAAGTVSNGLLLQYNRNGSTLVDFTAQHPIDANDEFQHFGKDFTLVDWAGTDNSLEVTLDFTLFSDGVILNGPSSDDLSIIVNDDFSGLVEMHFIAYGSAFIGAIPPPPPPPI